MRLVAFLQYIALLIGSIGMIAGQFFGLAKGFNLGVFVAGAGFAIAGIDSLVTRRMCFRPSDDVYENYGGTPAVIVGLMALVVGAAMIGAAYLLDNDHWQSTANYLIRRPAPLLAVGGLFLIGFGVLMMLNPSRDRCSAWWWSPPASRSSALARGSGASPRAIAPSSRRCRRGSTSTGDEAVAARAVLSGTHDLLRFFAASFTASMISGYAAQRQRLPER
jgi:hypothetical protein